MTADAERLSAIKGRLGATTAGWALTDSPNGLPESRVTYNSPEGMGVVADCDTTWRRTGINDHRYDDEAQADAEFIAHAPEDVDYLLTVATERDAEKERADRAEAALAALTNEHRVRPYSWPPIPYPDDLAHQVRWTIERSFRRARFDTGDDMEGFIAAADALIERYEMTARVALAADQPEPPHLDPLPMVCLAEGCEVARHSVSLLMSPNVRFQPRWADENGKPYSRDIEQYRAQS